MVSPIRLEDAIMEKEEIRDIILESMVASLEAQVRALKKLRGSPEAENPREKSMSQIGIVVNILTGAKRPLHVSEIIAKAEKVFGAKLERESLVSALSKKVMKGDRFKVGCKLTHETPPKRCDGEATPPCMTLWVSDYEATHEYCHDLAAQSGYAMYLG